MVETGREKGGTMGGRKPAGDQLFDRGDIVPCKDGQCLPGRFAESPVTREIGNRGIPPLLQLPFLSPPDPIYKGKVRKECGSDAVSIALPQIDRFT